jgi:acyl carrier protein
MTDNEIVESIKKVITNHAGIDESIITMDTNFYDDLNADSLDIIELTLRFEEAFKIDMAEEASLELKTVRDMFNYVKTKLEEKKLKAA